MNKLVNGLMSLALIQYRLTAWTFYRNTSQSLVPLVARHVRSENVFREQVLSHSAVCKESQPSIN